MNLVFEEVNNALLRDDFQACDNILKAADISKLPYNVMLALLTFTFAARDHLRERPYLVDRVFSRIAAEKGVEKADNILRTLR